MIPAVCIIGARGITYVATVAKVCGVFFTKNLYTAGDLDARRVTFREPVHCNGRLDARDSVFLDGVTAIEGARFRNCVIRGNVVSSGKVIMEDVNHGNGRILQGSQNSVVSHRDPDSAVGFYKG